MVMTRDKLDFNREKQVIVNLILSTAYCDKVLPVVKETYFESKYAWTVIKWVKSYYEAYAVAPKNHINEMFEEYGPTLDSDVHSQIGMVLQHLSDVSSTEIHNIPYLVDTANDLFREKHIQAQNRAVEHCLSKGDLIGAENIMLEHYNGIDGGGINFIRFNDEAFMQECIRDMVIQQDLDTAFFKFSGKLGEFIGACDRGWFIAFLAPAKRGKTTYMLDAVIEAVRQRLNTVVISLEMPEKQLMQRYALAITGAKPEAAPYTVMTPIMDCLHNQTGECDKPERVGVGAIATDGGIMVYDDCPDWAVCGECRGTLDFMPSAWKIPIEKKTITEGEYVKKVRRFNKFFGKYGRIIHIPSKTATVQELREAVQHLRNTENFIADVIVIDYADLIKPERGNGVKRHDLDDIWEGIRGWGQEEHALMISASQTNRLSADVKYLRDVHVAEDYSKIAKLDIALGLCQTDEMKELGIMNINKVAHRHKEYVQSHVCTVLQDISNQQSHLDSEFTVM